MTTIFKDSAMLAAGNVASQAVMVCALPVLTRLYSAGDFGVFYMLLSLLMLLKPLANLQYNSAMMLAKTRVDSLNLLALCLIPCAFLAILLVVAWGPLGSMVTRFVEGGEQLVPYGAAAAGLLVLLGTTQAVNSLLIHAGRFRLLAVVGLVTALGNRGAMIALGLFFTAGTWGLLLGTALGLCASLLVAGLRFVVPHFGPHLGDMSLRRVGELARRFKDFPLYSTWAVELDMAGRELPVLLLGLFHLPEVVGLYALGARVIRVPLMLVAEPLSKVFLQRASTGRESVGRVGSDFLEIISLLVLFGVPVLLVFMVFGGPLFALFFGPGWRMAGVYVQILCPSFLMMLFFQVVGAVCIAFERQRLLLVLGAMIAGVRIAAIAIPGALGSSPLVTLAVFSGASVAVYALAIGVFLSLLEISLPTFLRYVVARVARLLPLLALVLATALLAGDDIRMTLAGIAAAFALQGAVAWRTEPALKAFVHARLGRRG